MQRPDQQCPGEESVYPTPWISAEIRRLSSRSRASPMAIRKTTVKQPAVANPPLIDHSSHQPGARRNPRQVTPQARPSPNSSPGRE